MSRLLMAVCLLVLAVGCKKKAPKTDLAATPAVVTTSAPDSSTRSSLDYIRAVPQRSAAPYFMGKAKLNYADALTSFSATATIRVAQDSLIWMSLSPAMGIELARVLIRTDSVFVLDRVNDLLMVGSYADLSKFTGVPLAYSDLQSLVLGHAPYDSSRMMPFNNPESGYSAYRFRDQNNIRYTLVPNAQQYIGTWQINTPAKSTMDVSFEQHKNVTGAVAHFPWFRRLFLKWQSNAGQQYLKLDMTYTKAAYSDEMLPISFEVPADFKRTGF